MATISAGGIEDILYNNNKLSTGSTIVGKDATQMGMEDFMTLLMVQMQNQDIFNPSSDTDFVAQMAQFASLQGIQTLQEYTLSSYATSYVGKYVTIADYDSNGKLQEIQGFVQRVTFYNGEPLVVVDGKEYPLYQVMEVGSSLDDLKKPEEVDDDDDDDDGTAGGAGDGEVEDVSGKEKITTPLVFDIYP